MTSSLWGVISFICICDEREWCTDYGTANWVLVYFDSVIKRVKQCCCTLIVLPKSTLNANLTTTNRFYTNDDCQRGRFENFESDHQYESNLESDVRFEIESNHEASQILSSNVPFWSCFIEWSLYQWGQLMRRQPKPLRLTAVQCCCHAVGTGCWDRQIEVRETASLRQRINDATDLGGYSLR